MGDVPSQELRYNIGVAGLGYRCSILNLKGELIMNEFLLGAEEWLVHSYGYIALIAVVIVGAWLLTRKGFLWILFFMVVGAPLILWLAPISNSKAAAAGIKGSQNVMCQEFGGAYCDPSWATSGGSGSGGSSQSVITGTLKANATAILMSKIAQTYGLQPSDRIPVSAANLPAGVSLDLVCTKNATEVNEVWAAGLRDEVNGGTYTTEVNGKFARSWDLGGASCSNKNTATIRGTGNWSLCRECYESVTVTTTTPQAGDNTGASSTPSSTPIPGDSLTGEGCKSDYAASAGYWDGRWPEGYPHSQKRLSGLLAVCHNNDWISQSEFQSQTGKTPEEGMRLWLAVHPR